MRPRADAPKALPLYGGLVTSDGERGKIMHPDMMLDLARLHIEELRNEAARARLVKDPRRARSGSRASRFRAGIGLKNLRSKAA